MSAQGNSARAREAAFDRLGAMVRAAETGEVSEHVSLAGRERLLASLAKPQRSAKVVRLAWVGGGTALAAAAAVLLALNLRHAPLPGWSAENAVAAEDGYVSTAKPDESATLRFTSGARVELSGGSRGRVVDASQGHARVVLEAGRASVHGAHTQLSFMIQAGPFALVGDRDSAFDVAWSGDTLDVRVSSGAVKVDGPSAQGLSLHGDQHLVTSVSDGGLRLERTSAENEPQEKGPDLAAAGTHGAADDESPAPSPETATTAPRATAQARSLSWAQHVAAGEYDVVLREAESRGIDSAVRKGSLAEVSALADAARYAGRSGIAKRALASERVRFAGSSEARTAAFLLGRLAEDTDGDAVAAIGWYDRYLAEAPKGPLASEALGRKMLLVVRTSGADAAKPIAVQYLRRFPKGSYASVARQYAP